MRTLLEWIKNQAKIKYWEEKGTQKRHFLISLHLPEIFPQNIADHNFYIYTFLEYKEEEPNLNSFFIKLEKEVRDAQPHRYIEHLKAIKIDTD